MRGNTVCFSLYHDSIRRKVSIPVILFLHGPHSSNKSLIFPACNCFNAGLSSIVTSCSFSTPFKRRIKFCRGATKPVKNKQKNMKKKRQSSFPPSYTRSSWRHKTLWFLITSAAELQVALCPEKRERGEEEGSWPERKSSMHSRGDFQKTFCDCSQAVSRPESGVR